MRESIVSSMLSIILSMTLLLPINAVYSMSIRSSPQSSSSSRLSMSMSPRPRSMSWSIRSGRPGDYPPREAFRLVDGVLSPPTGLFCFRLTEAATEGAGTSDDLSWDFSDVLSSSPDKSDLPLPRGWELSGSIISDSYCLFALLCTTGSFNFSSISALDCYPFSFWFLVESGP